jgi:hypothetical protein
MGILYGDRLGAWYVGRGAIVGDGVARAAVDSPHRVRQAHRSRRGAKAQAVLSESDLLRTMFDVGYFPPNALLIE